MKKYRLGLAGCGYLAKIIVNAYEKGLLPDYELVGIFGKTPEHAETLAKHVDQIHQKQNSDAAPCKACESIEMLLEQKPDYIAEAASVACVKAIALPVLRSGCSLVVVSIGAFADEAFKKQVEEAASEHGTKIYIASGAVGGFDVLRTISLMGQAEASFVSKKHPGSLRNTPLFSEELMEKSENEEVFSGSAKEAIALLPTKVNVAVATALASVGPENLKVSINSVPDMVGDDYVITSEIPGMRACLNIYSATSEIAAWSEVAVLRNIASPFVF